jgi:hypothetical protein
MDRRVTEGPHDEYRRKLEGLRRRTDWEHGPASRPDPDWEHGPAARPNPDWESADDPLAALRDLVGALLRRPRGRLPRL